ncbi:helix-turn-helix domain-containing protein [Dethiothermospora halolimnae]|uniref:helix-turn-helix domain-containing protein n=1 Tax=Dethiothermospora halolimnae TaxID=3114390 RepID=UPI003CCBB0E2
MENKKLTLGEKIKKERKKHGMTQSDLAGDFITRTMLSKIENDVAKPSIETIQYISEKLDLPVSYFIESMVRMDMNKKSNVETAFEHSSFLRKNNGYEKSIKYLEDTLEKNEFEKNNIYYYRCLYNLASSYREMGNINKAKDILKSIIPVLEEKKDYYYLSRVHSIIGYILFERDQYKDSEYNLFKSIEYLEKSYVDDIIHEIRINYNLAYCYYLQKKYDDALKYLKYALTLSDERNCNYNLGYMNMLMGVIYNRLDNIEKAVYYTDKGRQFFNFKDDFYYKALCQQNLGIYYTKLGDYDKALDNLKSSLKYFENRDDDKKINDIIADTITALTKKGYYDEVNSYIDRVDEELLSDKSRAIYYINIARYLINKEDIAKAKEYLSKVEDLSDNKYILHDLYIELGNISSMEGDYKKAYDLSKKAREIIGDFGLAN